MRRPDPLPRDLRGAARRQVSTLEATVQVLAMLDGPTFDAPRPCSRRLRPFVAARQRPQASSGQTRPAAALLYPLPTEVVCSQLVAVLR